MIVCQQLWFLLISFTHVHLLLRDFDTFLDAPDYPFFLVRLPLPILDHPYAYDSSIIGQLKHSTLVKALVYIVYAMQGYMGNIKTYVTNRFCFAQFSQYIPLLGNNSFFKAILLFMPFKARQGKPLMVGGKFLVVRFGDKVQFMSVPLTFSGQGWCFKQDMQQCTMLQMCREITTECLKPRNQMIPLGINWCINGQT